MGQKWPQTPNYHLSNTKLSCGAALTLWMNKQHLEEAERERELCLCPQARLCAGKSSQTGLWWLPAARGPTGASGTQAEQSHAEAEECLGANDPASAAAEPQLSLVTALMGLVDGSAAVLNTNVFPALSSPLCGPTAQT